MKEFEELNAVLDRLLAPDGCPWDREQTLQSMRSSLLEETSEVLEAIDLDQNHKIEEELGDLFFNVLFLCKLAEKEHRFTVAEVLHHVATKLIRRHPHIFGEAVVKNSEEVLKQWEEIKNQEKQGQTHSLLGDIPKNLSSLARAQKIYRRLKKNQISQLPFQEDPFKDEDALGAALFEIVKQSQEKGLDAEQALRKYLAKLDNLLN